VTATENYISIELAALLDNASIKGIEIDEVGGANIVRINCGGPALTTQDGNQYIIEEGFFNPDVSSVATREQWMKAAMNKYFNYGACGNSFKWSGIQPQHTEPNYTNFENAVQWTQKVGWELRAHTLLWGGNDDHSMPGWVRNLPTPQAITDTCKMRVIREMTRYKGIIKEYDVINEPLTGHADHLRNTVGDSILWNCFKWAHSADPGAELFINDYNVEYNWGQAAEYRDLILKIKEMGGPVTSVGMQAHFWECCRPNVDELVRNVNIVAEAGLPIRFTEYDYDGNLTQKQQAEDFIKVLTVAFSHPSITGMICWALSDDGAWRENSGFFDANHKPKIAADTLLYYIKTKWATNFDSVMNNGNTLPFNAYYGDYNIEVAFNDTVKVFTIPCLKENTDSVFTLNEADAKLKGPEFISARILSDTSIAIVFDKPILEESIYKGDYKFFSNNPLGIQDIKIDQEDSNAIIVYLEDLITPEDYLSVHYFPGSLSSKDGGKSASFGPENVVNLTLGLLSASVINNGVNIEAVFNKKVINLIDNEPYFTIKDNGQEIEITGLEYADNDSAKALFTLATAMTSTSKPTMSYTGGTLQSIADFKCQYTDNLNVTNNWPKLVSAEVNSTGTMVIAIFNTVLNYVPDNIDAFTITVDDQPVVISDVSVTGEDVSTVTFKLSDVIYKGQIVTLSYEPGTVTGQNGNQMMAISDKRVSNTSVTAIEDITTELFTIYPIPATDHIRIEGKSAPFRVNLINSLGIELYSGFSETELFEMDVRNYNGGIYFIKVTNMNNNVGVLKIVLK
ncbi:MAG: endo-1,4-beta-xylanase, partial [Bacteroidales bacterium]|nr:endo-1,4-beta-xylanase [Bacteroidales bacterium]